MIKVKYTSKFAKAFKRLPKNIQNRAVKKIEIFQSNPYTPSLKTHKLGGNLEAFHAFAINHQYKILFKFENEKGIVLLNVGTHSIYR